MGIKDAYYVLTGRKTVARTVTKRKLSPAERERRQATLKARKTKALEDEVKGKVRMLQTYDRQLQGKYTKLNIEADRLKDQAARLLNDPVNKDIKYDGLVTKVGAKKEQMTMLHTYRKVLNKVETAYEKGLMQVDVAKVFKDCGIGGESLQKLIDRVRDEGTDEQIINDMIAATQMDELTDSLAMNLAPYLNEAISSPAKEEIDAEIQALYEQKYAQKPVAEGGVEATDELKVTTTEVEQKLYGTSK